MTGESDSHRWASHPVAARLLRLAIRLSPVAVAGLVSWQLALRTRTLAHRHEIAVFCAITAVTVAVGFAVERLARRLLPLTTLLALTLLFPDRAPSRWRVSRDSLRTDAVRHPDGDLSQHSAALLATLTSHDRRTRGHSERVRLFADMLGQQLGLSRNETDRLRWAALLHDIGKVDVPQALLNKPGKPTTKEWGQLKLHPLNGAKLIGPGLQAWLGEWGLGVPEHHERFDGTGYPRGLQASEISRAGRILAVVDAYEVMTAARSYKRPMSIAKAREELARCAGTHFDPVMVRAFLAISLPRMLWTTGPFSLLVNLPFLARLDAAARTIPTLATPAAKAAGVLAVGAVVTGTSTVGATAGAPAAATHAVGGSAAGAPAAPRLAGPSATSATARPSGATPARPDNRRPSPVPTSLSTPTVAPTSGAPSTAPTRVARPSAAPTTRRTDKAAPTTAPTHVAAAPTSPPTAAPTHAPLPSASPTPVSTAREVVVLDRTPGPSSTDEHPVFSWHSQGATRYVLTLDGRISTYVRAYRGTSASVKIRHLSAGQHTVTVTAVDQSGRPLGPATSYTWRLGPGHSGRPH